ncbi:hypothetical protein [Carboxylicivirga marina]|uniref:Uncharacterized protein n=1 Tax=Carboxylicivirga marina TaxID=2800988 RepID=A0ABS1HNY4_9BACT|nr:hypothetical protein [Carboxylicivirga marina]MBK3519374.1 hypothetical protein [Carboxylicivirga marina]
MKPTQNNILKHPSKKNLIIITAVWLISMVLLVLSMTDLFTEKPFQKSYLLMYFLMLSSTVSVIKMHMNYQRNKERRICA